MYDNEQPPYHQLYPCQNSQHEMDLDIYQVELLLVGNRDIVWNPCIQPELFSSHQQLKTKILIKTKRENH